MSVLDGEGLDRSLRCPRDVETATEFYDAGSGINAGLCCGCGMARDDHVAA